MAFSSLYAVVYVIVLRCDLALQQHNLVPNSKVELLYPVGFAVSIPDRERIRMVAIHSKINEEFHSYQDGGLYSMNITSAKNNRWTYTDKTKRFKIGDVINYWIFVEYSNSNGKNRFGYTSQYRRFNVTECPRRIMNAEKICNASDPSHFVFPDHTVEVLKPKGFSVSIPDEQGIHLFGFHGKINEPFRGRESGFFARDTKLAKNGRWTFTDNSTELAPGDTIYFWLYVSQWNDKEVVRGHVKENLQYVVPGCSRRIINAEEKCKAPDASHFEFPSHTVKILKPKGFSISIPDEQGIHLFGFHGKINEPFRGRESGFFSRDTKSAKNGRWTFTDNSTELAPGDTIYFWLYVSQWNDKGVVRGHLKENLQFLVPDVKSCAKSFTQWNGETTCVGQLIFMEEFESALMSNWTREIKYSDDPDYEFVIYDKYKQNLNTESGMLHIKPSLAEEKFGEGFIYSQDGYDLGSSCTSNKANDCIRKSISGYVLPPILSGRITSKHSFKYGRVDIRAKLPKGDWIYPQLFLSPKHYEYGTDDYNSGEIRIAFVTGNKILSSELKGQILLGTTTKARAFGVARSTKLNEVWSDNYHIYSVLWKPDSLIFLVDNTEYGRISPSNGFWDAFQHEKPETAARWKAGTPLAPFDKEMVIKIGVGVGGHSFPDTIPSKPYTNDEAKPQLKFYRAKNEWQPTWEAGNELVTDYVKVYAL